LPPSTPAVAATTARPDAPPAAAPVAEGPREGASGSDPYHIIEDKSSAPPRQSHIRILRRQRPKTNPDGLE
jgi:hypothetical protein